MGGFGFNGSQLTDRQAARKPKFGLDAIAGNGQGFPRSRHKVIEGIGVTGFKIFFDDQRWGIAGFLGTIGPLNLKTNFGHRAGQNNERFATLLRVAQRQESGRSRWILPTLRSGLTPAVVC